MILHSQEIALFISGVKTTVCHFYSYGTFQHKWELRDKIEVEDIK